LFAGLDWVHVLARGTSDQLSLCTATHSYCICC